MPLKKPKLKPAIASNRTKVELKLKHLKAKQKKPQPSNRTKVELKHPKLIARLSDLNFQSNQSGIETWDSKLRTTYNDTSNRTKVELKQRKAYLIKSNIRFQSNQSGIETLIRYPTSSRVMLPIEPKWNWNSLHWKKRWHWISSNRTKVELKPGCNTQRIAANCFQSNQSGIETQ